MSTANEGGLVEVQNALINYVVGNGADFTYSASVKVFQGSVKTTSIDIYKQFNGALGTSNQTLLKSIAVPAGGTGSLDFEFSYTELIAGLSINGTALPADDTQLSIGDAFTLTYKATTDAGNTVTNRGTTKVAVSTRFAGIYNVIASAYYHPTAGFLGDWNGSQVIIESVDPITYHILANGPFNTDDDPDNEFYFTIDADGNIDVPKEYDGAVQTVWGGADEVANCDDDPSELPDACPGLDGSGSNFVIKDDVNGLDQILMAHGYIRDTGTRQFFYRLEKAL
jgi:hypothetical protein